jgi:hypothetical protein
MLERDTRYEYGRYDRFWYGSMANFQYRRGISSHALFIRIYSWIYCSLRISKFAHSTFCIQSNPNASLEASLRTIHKKSTEPKSKFNFLDFKISPCFECRMLPSGLFPGVCSINADVSEHSVCSIFIGEQVSMSRNGRWPSYSFSIVNCILLWTTSMDSTTIYSSQRKRWRRPISITGHWYLLAYEDGTDTVFRNVGI